MRGQRNKDYSIQYKKFKCYNDHFQGKGKRRDKHIDKFKVECYECHNFGHYHSECHSKLPNNKEKGEKLNFVEKKEIETLLTVAQVNEEP